MDKVVQVIQAFCPNEYASLAEATVAAMQKNKLNAPKCKLINGKIVESYQFSGNFLTICFENGKYLTVYPGETSINWDVISDKPTMIEMEENQNICFEFSNGEKIFWNWKLILDSFVGKQIAISPSDQFLFIFPRYGDEYMFDALIDVHDVNNRFLWLSKT